MQAHIALILVNLIYAFSYGVSKEIIGVYLPPAVFISLRVIGACLLFWLFFFKTEKIERKDFLKIALASAFGIAFNKLLLYEGLANTSPVNTSIIMVSSPILVLIIASILIKEKLTALKIIGITIGLAGAVCLILFGSKASDGSVNWYGDTLILLNATFYSIYLVLIKPLIIKYNPYTFVKWAFTFGILFILPFGIATAEDINPIIPTAVIYKVIGIIIFATFLTYLLTVYAIDKVSPTVVGSYIYLQPIFASFFAVYYGKEEVSLFKIGCGLAIFIGVYLIGKKSITQPLNATSKH